MRLLPSMAAWALAYVFVAWSPASMAAAAADVAASSPRAMAAAAARGRVLMARYHCGSCHVIPGVPAARGSTAMALDGYGRRSYIAGRVPNDPAGLVRWIMDPQAVIPGTLMPSMGVSRADAHDMAAYLGQLE